MGTGEGQTGREDGGTDDFFDDGGDERGDAVIDTAESTATSGMTGDAGDATSADLPPPPVTGHISWTGLAAPAAETPVAAETSVAAETPAAPESSAPATTASDGEKKVVWSSSPTKGYSSFGSGTRRDDY